MINVAALTSGKFTPSARFRIRQHIGPLRSRGIFVQERLPLVDKYAPLPSILRSSNQRALTLFKSLWKSVKAAARIPETLSSWRYDITWLERELHPGFVSFEPLLKRPIVLDVDDAVWLHEPFGRSAAQKTANIAEIVIAGNNHIANWFDDHARNVRIVPTAIDTGRIKPKRKEEFEHSSRPFIVGWTGTSSNFRSLYSIEAGLNRFLKSCSAQLWLMADRPPAFKEIRPESVRFFQWAPDREYRILCKMDVGLMPLSEDPWSLGKCSFKMLQYMAAALPVVVSPVGMNAEILAMGNIGFSAVTQTDWYEALKNLFTDTNFSFDCGANGRLIVENYFSRQVVSGMLSDIFISLS
jgi:glycosyltransferase involved in cell wall biosynthesis